MCLMPLLNLFIPTYRNAFSTYPFIIHHKIAPFEDTHKHFPHTQRLNHPTPRCRHPPTRQCEFPRGVRCALPGGRAQTFWGTRLLTSCQWSPERRTTRTRALTGKARIPLLYAVELCITLIKKKRTFSSYISKFRREQLQSHIRKGS